MTRTRRIISFGLASLLLLSGVVALIWMLLARDYSHGPWKLWAISIAAAAVAITLGGFWLWEDFHPDQRT